MPLHANFLVGIYLRIQRNQGEVASFAIKCTDGKL